MGLFGRPSYQELIELGIKYFEAQLDDDLNMKRMTDLVLACCKTSWSVDEILPVAEKEYYRRVWSS